MSRTSALTSEPRRRWRAQRCSWRPRASIERLALALRPLVPHRAISGYCHLYAALGIAPPPYASSRIERAGLLVAVDADQAYRFCRSPDNLARFLFPLRQVDTSPAQITKSANALADRLHLLLTEDVPGRRLRWQSQPSLPFRVDLSLDFLGVSSDRGTASSASWSPDRVNNAPAEFAAALASFNLKTALSRLRLPMKAVCWHGKQDVRVETVPDPSILNPRDAIVKITSTAICGSDLHLYNCVIPRMEAGDILGHEFMGEIVEMGRENGLRKGDRVVIPFTIACGDCFFCKRQLHSLCDNSNPDAATAATLYGHSSAGLFGYSHIFRGYAGGQAEYVRVPFADVGAFKIPTHIPDEQALFLTDIFPTGYMAAENCNIQPGDTIAVWGCGPVGQFAIRSAFLLGAANVIAIDH